MLDSRPKSRGFEPHRLYCVLVLHIYPSLVLVQPRKICPCLTERLLIGRKESNQTNRLKVSDRAGDVQVNFRFPYKVCWGQCIFTIEKVLMGI